MAAQIEKSTITLTFGDQGENHVGMQKIGSPAEKGFSVENLQKFQKDFEKMGMKCELIDLNEICNESKEKAGLLIIRSGIDILLKQINKTLKELYEEQTKLSWDKKCFMYGRVVNKHARHNLCYADFDQEPDYEEKKGRIVAFKKIPLTKYIKEMLEKMLNCKLIGEGNKYFDVTKCGIGYHGDTERKIVIGCRIGEDMSLHYNWYFKGNAVGKNLKIVLKSGDMYIMSEKAVGFDWKKRNIYTLRHAAGSKKFTMIKEKEKKKMFEKLYISKYTI